MLALALSLLSERKRLQAELEKERAARHEAERVRESDRREVALIRAAQARGADSLLLDLDVIAQRLRGQSETCHGRETS